jgi:hypothetical protein
VLSASPGRRPQIAAALFRGGDPAVAADDEGYHLRFSVPDELFRDGGGLHDAASVLLRRVNGVARTLSSDVRPVGLTGRFSDETGRHHQVVLADSAEVRARANPVRVSMSGEQPPPPLLSLDLVRDGHSLGGSHLIWPW